MSHSYFYVMQWRWYEWLGAIGPILIFLWLTRVARSRKMRNLELLSRTLALYQTAFVIIGLVAVPHGSKALPACSQCAVFTCRICYWFCFQGVCWQNSC